LTGFGLVSGVAGPASGLGLLVPTAFVADTVNQYFSPFCRPSMVHGEAEHRCEPEPPPRQATV
jgi:hypothetical protein